VDAVGCETVGLGCGAVFGRGVGADDVAGTAIGAGRFGAPIAVGTAGRAPAGSIFFTALAGAAFLAAFAGVAVGLRGFAAAFFALPAPRRATAFFAGLLAIFFAAFFGVFVFFFASFLAGLRTVFFAIASPPGFRRWN
jgi:hypothetical protein